MSACRARLIATGLLLLGADLARAQAEPRASPDLRERDAAVYRGLSLPSGRVLSSGALVFEHASHSSFGAKLGATDHLQLGVRGSPSLNQLDAWYVSGDAALGASSGLLHGALWAQLGWNGGRDDGDDFAGGAVGATGQLCFEHGCNWALSTGATVGRGRTTGMVFHGLLRLGFGIDSPMSLLLEPSLWTRLDSREDPRVGVRVALRFAARFGTVDLGLIRIGAGSGSGLALALRFL